MAKRGKALGVGLVVLVGLGALGAWLFLTLPALSGRADDVATAPRPVIAAEDASTVGVAARGRLEPRDGLSLVAGPSEMVLVVQQLLVDKGDKVKAGQVIAVLDQESLRQAAVERAKAQVANAEAEARRARELNQGNVLSDSQREDLETRLAIARAELRSGEVALERQYVHAPFDGQVIEVLAREGERASAGIIELGRTDRMYAIAEVYETDIGRVQLGQRATVTSPALPRPLEGTIDRIGRKVGKLDTIGADPAARTDARVVEVEIRLDDSEPAASLTNLQVEIAIRP